MKKLQGKAFAKEPGTPVTLTRSIAWGALAGLAGTMAMDLVMAGGLSALDLPLDTCYRTIGNTATHFFSLFGLQLVGDFAMGVAAYHLIGPLLGAFYGLIVSQVGSLQRATLKKALLWAVLYAEIVSQLILTLVPVLLRMPGQEAILWYAGSSILHGVWGIVMGFAAYFLPKASTRKNIDMRSEGMGEISWKTR